MSAGMFIGFAIVIWIFLITLVLSIARAAHDGDEASAGEMIGRLDAGRLRGDVLPDLEREPPRPTPAALGPAQPSA